MEIDVSNKVSLYNPPEDDELFIKDLTDALAKRLNRGFVDPSNNTLVIPFKDENSAYWFRTAMMNMIGQFVIGRGKMENTQEPVPELVKAGYDYLTPRSFAVYEEGK